MKRSEKISASLRARKHRVPMRTILTYSLTFISAFTIPPVWTCPFCRFLKISVKSVLVKLKNKFDEFVINKLYF